MKDVVKQTIELDTAFTRLQMVTMSNREEIEKLKDSYIALARELRVPLSTVTDAAETWLRTGMDAAEANKALQASIILSTDAFMEGADASKVLIATQKAYKFQTEELMDVVDKLTTLDAKAATTAQDLGEAIALSGASASVAGISFDKYLGLIATASEVTQQSSSVIGNAWKTLTARLRKVGAGATLDEEGEDISDVDKVLKQYGINLREVSDGMTNMEKVIDEIGKRWKLFNGEQKAQIATAVAGTRQQNVFIATMENYDRVLELTQVSLESEGSAMDKFGTYVESTQAKIDELKTSWTAFADATLNIDMVEWFISAGNAALQFGEKAGGLIPIVTALGVALLGLKIGGGTGFGIAGAVAGIGLGIYQASQVSQSKWITENIENQKAETDKLVDSQNKERKEVEALMVQYLKLNQIKDRTVEQEKEYKDVSGKLADSLGIQRKELEAQIKTFKDYANAYQNFLAQQTVAQIASKSKDLEDLQSQFNVLEGTLSELQKQTMTSGTPESGFSLFFYELFNKKKIESAREELGNLRNSIEVLQNELKTVKDEGQQFMETISSAIDWEKSRNGANELKKTLEGIDKIIDSLRAKRESASEEEKKRIDSLIDSYSSFLQIIKDEYDTFVSTDFVVQDYYDIHLKKLKEVQEMEEQVQKQREAQEKITEAEKKKQEALLDVEKKRAELAEAREKRIKVFRMGKGFVYEEDTQSIAKAQENLDKSLDAYTKAQESYEKTIADVMGTATEQMIKLIEALKSVYAQGVVASNGGLREYFLDKKNVEEFSKMSPSDQFKTLVEKGKLEGSSMWNMLMASLMSAGSGVPSGLGIDEKGYSDAVSTYAEQILKAVFGEDFYKERISQKQEQENASGSYTPSITTGTSTEPSTGTTQSASPSLDETVSGGTTSTENRSANGNTSGKYEPTETYESLMAKRREAAIGVIRRKKFPLAQLPLWLSVLGVNMDDEDIKKAINEAYADEIEFQENAKNVPTATSPATSSTNEEEYVPRKTEKLATAKSNFWGDQVSFSYNGEEYTMYVNTSKRAPKEISKELYGGSGEVYYGADGKLYYLLGGNQYLLTESPKDPGGVNRFFANYNQPSTYHTGGIVGKPAFKSDNEMYAKLLKGEIVLPQDKFSDILNKVQTTNNSDSKVINIGSVSLPNVNDADSFVAELQRIGYSR